MSICLKGKQRFLFKRATEIAKSTLGGGGGKKKNTRGSIQAAAVWAPLATGASRRLCQLRRGQACLTAARPPPRAPRSRPATRGTRVASSSRVTHHCPVQRAPEELRRALDTPPAHHLQWIPSRSGQATKEYPRDGPGSAAAEGRPSSGCSAEVSGGLSHGGEARKAPRGVCVYCARAGREKVAFYERALPVSCLSASSAARNIFTHTQVCTSLSGQGFLAFPLASFPLVCAVAAVRFASCTPERGWCSR